MSRRHTYRPIGALISAVMVAAGVTAFTGPAATASSPTTAAMVHVTSPDSAAGSAADAFVARRPAALHPGAGDAFVRRAAYSSHGWRYVPYERTYHGLPVIGGDLVVVVDPSGQVSSTSVAQRSAIGSLDTRPTLTRAQAEQVAAKRLTTLTRIRGSRLVVDATGAGPRLLWESTVEGTGPAGHSLLTVGVDAATGTVVRTTENVHHNTGHAALNGGVVSVPAVAITFTPPSNGPTTWIMGIQDGGLHCNGTEFKRVDPQPLEWGNGDPADRETACVDAMYGSSRQMDMLGEWLGRDGLSGNGYGWPIFTTSGVISNAYYVQSGTFNQPEVHIGRSPAGNWWSAIDIVGHEHGHGIDDHTPGGMSGNGTSEFIADAFGTATEWYANRPAPYDTPDYVIGDHPLIANPAKRYMYHPGLDGSPNCYSAAVPSMQVHAAAGVGDHWFYLLAEGSAPTNGQPPSPTCNGSTVAGIGIRDTMKILYNAMLMKNSNSSYLAYRKWTLTAARNLFPGNCAIINSVRAAWDAVSVPPQPGEPAVCVPGLAGLTQAGATTALTNTGLALGSVSQQVSLAPAGTVVAQNPNASIIVPFGTAVSIVVSAGGVEVPNVMSLPKSVAISVLNGVGLPVTTSNQHACIDPGGVLVQSRQGGSVVLPGTTIHLTIDSGTRQSCGIIS